MMLHPESTAYDQLDGNTYEIAALPTRISAQAQLSMGPGILA